MWETLWQVVLVGILGAFAAMSVLVTVFGAMDIRRMLRQLESAESIKERTRSDGAEK